MQGELRYGRRRKVRSGKEGRVELGQARQAWGGLTRSGLERQGEESQARQGFKWLVTGGGLRHGTVRVEGTIFPSTTQIVHLLFFFMVKKNYVYKKTAFVRRGVKAQTAGEELQRIQKEHGEVTPPLVVDEARPDESPIHEVFEWDDWEAAEQYREHQARNLIRSIEIVETQTGKTEPVFIHVQSEKAYLPTQVVVNNVDLFEEARNAAERRLREASASLKQLKQIANDKKQKKVQTAINFLSKAQDQLAD